jgi:hypothetical protein
MAPSVTEKRKWVKDLIEAQIRLKKKKNKGMRERKQAGPKINHPNDVATLEKEDSSDVAEVKPNLIQSGVCSS